MTSLGPRADVEQRPPSRPDERLKELARRIQEWLDESQTRAGSLAEILEMARRESVRLATPAGSPAAGSPAGAGLPAAELREIARFAAEVERSADQAAILGRLADGAARHASRVVLLVSRHEALVGWTARGFAAGFSARRIVVQASGDSVVCRARAAGSPAVEPASGTAGNGQIAALLGDDPPRLMMAAPLWVRDRVVAVLYADTDARGAWNPDAIAVMTSLAALSLEAIPARSKFPRPAALPPAEPEAAPAPGADDDWTPAATAPAAPEAGGVAPAAGAGDPDQEEMQLRDEARRFARLLVSEILLYNEKEIEEGRRNKDLYERLKEDIERSRQMYLHRVSPRMTGAPDYFRQELVRTLAAGDESALNAPWD